MKERYLVHIPKKNHLTGILHQRNNLFALLMEAKFLNRIAIIPPLLLNGKHNNGKNIETSWDKYIDIKNIQSFHHSILQDEFDDFNNLPSNLIDENTQPHHIINEKISLIIREHKRYPNYYILINMIGREDWYLQLIDLFRPSEKIIEYANLAIKSMDNYNCIHVRRGDKLNWKQCPGLEKATQPKKLKSFLLKNIPKGEKLYIMSNESKVGYFDLLKNYYTVFTYNLFPEYILLEKNDNYFLFMVETEIMKHAKIKIKTFEEVGYISLLNYGPNGKDLLINKIRRRARKLLKGLSKK